MPVECGNPLLLEWIKEWYDAARERNSKGATTYKMAYDSMRACPLAFSHPLEAQQLHGLGPKLCERLTEKLKLHCAENGLPMPEPPHTARKRQSGDVSIEQGPPKKPRKTKPYVPSLHSGPYALILALSIPEESSNGLSKSQTIELAQPHCDSSFTAPSDPTKFYTAWSSMKTLLEKDLVYERGRPSRKYALTEEGWEVAKRIQTTRGGPGKSDDMTKHGKGKPASGPDFDQFVNLEDDFDIDQAPVSKRNLAAISSASSHLHKSHSRSASPVNSRSHLSIPNTSQAHVSHTLASTESHPSGQQSSLDSFQPIRVPPGTFTVELLLDNREVRAKTDRDYIQDELTKRGVQPIVRSLELGDALWVAKCKDPSFLARHGEEGDEIVLDWIVERKRLDDLVGSIKDGRFHEQKFRLRKSGVKNVIYIIEEISMSQETISKYQEAVETAISSTQVVNGYFVKKTQKLDDTIRYLARMTMMLKSLYESKPLTLIPSSHLHPTTYLPLLSTLHSTHPFSITPTTFNITYPSFSSLASKSDSLTLRDVFLKMLMCTRGITGDKALEIQKHWSTPRAFVEAFEELGGGLADGGDKDKVNNEMEIGKRKRELVWSVAGGLVGRRKVGKAVSAKVAEVWGYGGS